MMKCVSIILVLALCTMGQQVTRQCPSSLQCRVSQQCPEFLQQNLQLKSLTKGTARHTSLRARLRDRVCDSTERKVCCDTGTEISGSIGPTEPHEFPFMVRLDIQSFKCGASLITPRFLATAYHCFYSTEYPKLNFDTDCREAGQCVAVVRQHDLTVKEAWERKIDIARVHRPPFGNSDLALAELADAVVLDSRAQLVKMATERLRVDDLVLHLGWGQAFQGAFPDTLLKVQLRVSEVDSSSDQTFTAVAVNELNIPVDPCDGDSGGPLLYKKDGEWELYATLQGGSYDCEDDKTIGDGIWNSLAAHNDWIRDVINAAGPGVTSRILLTGGGWDGSRLSSSSVFPSSPACPPPSLPAPRSSHVTFTTASGLVATCGGLGESRTRLSSCLVLEAGRWRQDPRVPDLPQPRYGAASATVAGAGVYILGGEYTEKSSQVLSTGGSWEEGPTLPGGGAWRACAVAWGGSIVLVGGEPEYNQVREYDTIRKKWEEEAKWPQLAGKGRFRHGCSLLGSQLIVAGGWDSGYSSLSSTSSLELGSGAGRRAAWLEGGSLKTARYGLALVTVGEAGRQRLYALGGVNGDYRELDTVERWEEGGRRWEEEEERLPEGRHLMGAVAVTEDVCTA